MKHIVISGATGFIGTHLTAHMEEMGHRCTMITRRPRNLPGALSWQDDLPHNTDIVIHLAGTSVAALWTPRKRRAILNSRLESTERLGEMMRALPRPPEAFLCASAVGIYGNRPGQTITEETLPDPGKRFRWEVCDAWEQAAQQACPAGARLVQLRLGNVLHPSGGMLEKLDQIYRWPIVPGFGLGDPKTHLAGIRLDDMLRLIAFTCGNDSIRGPLNVTSPKRLTYGQFYTELCERHHKRCWLHLPRFLLRLGLGELARAVTDDQYVYPKKAIEAGFEFSPTKEIW